jgi:hypothetical protein
VADELQVKVVMGFGWGFSPKPFFVSVGVEDLNGNRVVLVKEMSMRSSSVVSIVQCLFHNYDPC